MTVTINGTDGIDLENFNLDEDSSGNLIIVDPDGNTVFTYDNTANEWQLGDNLNVNANNINNSGSSIPLGDSLDAQSNDISNVGALSTEVLSDNHRYAGAYNGADADARLTNAISAAQLGDVIYLEKADYTTDRTISKRLLFVGTGGRTLGTVIDATWTLTSEVGLTNVYLEDQGSGVDTIKANQDYCQVNDCECRTGCEIYVDGYYFRYVNNTFGDITFSSSTGSGIVDASVGVSVTDNGTNTVGDIA